MRWWRLAVFCAALVVPLFGRAAAFALPQRGHTFAFSFPSGGSAEEEPGKPSAVAVARSNGDVFVADYGSNRVEVFEPVLDGQGVLTGERLLRSIPVPAPTAIVVDDTTEGADPSRGDVYVVGSSKHELKEEEPNKRVFKFSPEGTEILAIRKFKEPVEKGEEPEEAEELEEVQGLAVDPAGHLYVYGSGAVDVYTSAAKNRSLLSIPAPLTATHGLALDTAGDLYVGHESEDPEAAGPEGPAPVVGKLEATAGTPLVSELERQPSTAVAVNTEDVAANKVDEQNDVYVANPGGTSSAGSSIAQLSPAGSLIQRFTTPGLIAPSGVAVDDRTGDVFITDAASNKVDVFALEEPGSPTIDQLTARVLPSGTTSAANTARVHTTVDPVGLATRYSLEYGPAACSESSDPCSKAAEGELPESFDSSTLTFALPGLAPGVYHYRLTVSHREGPSARSEQTFTILTQTSGLPDGRALELVSPPEKGGAAIEALTREGGFVLAAEDGGAFTYVANGAIVEEAQGNRSFEPQQVLAVRGRSSWSTQDIATANEKAAGANFGAPEYRYFSPDLSVALVEPFSAEPPLAPEMSGQAVYLRADPPLTPEAAQQKNFALAQANSTFVPPGFAPLLSSASAPQAHLPANARFADATPDLQHVLLESTSALAGSSSGPGLYEWSQGSTLSFVSALPEGKPAPQVALGYYHTRAHAISNDGSRVFWTASQETPAHLYMRNTAGARTIQLDKAQEGLTEPTGAAKFQTASVDGSRAFFTDTQALVPGATGEPQREISDLYACEIAGSGPAEACNLRDLTIPLRPDERGAVQGFMLGSSEDGSTVFLVAHGVLAENENANGEAAEPGAENLYELHHQGSAWTRTFIAQLSAEDSPDWDQGKNVSDENTSFQTTRVSPNGRYLAFMSNRSLTGYDNEDASSEHPGQRLDEEVFLFDSQTGALTCASCNPSGARPTGVLDQEHSGEGIGLLVDRRESWRGQWIAGNIPGGTSESLVNSLIQSRYLSNEGRLYFDSADPLVEGVSAPLREELVNGNAQQVGVENAYEYEPAGVGGCAGAAGGCVALLSGGSSNRESAFLEATPTGSDVFLITGARLSPLDADGAFDVYDARECTTASPCLSPPPSALPPCTSPASCHPATTIEASMPLTSGTAGFDGFGNLKSQPKPPSTVVVAGRRSTKKPLTRAQKLAEALAQCHKQYPHSRSRRRACEARARKLYGPKPHSRTHHAQRHNKRAAR